jgi:hypothetical protein
LTHATSSTTAAMAISAKTTNSVSFPVHMPDDLSVRR